MEEIRNEHCKTHQEMDASSNVQSIVKEPVTVLVRGGWSDCLAQVIVTVARHECTVLYSISIARNTPAISTQHVIVCNVITPERHKICLTGYHLTTWTYIVTLTSLQATISIMFITNVHNISKRFLHFLTLNAKIAIMAA